VNEPTTAMNDQVVIGLSTWSSLHAETYKEVILVEDTPFISQSHRSRNTFSFGKSVRIGDVVKVILTVLGILPMAK